MWQELRNDELHPQGIEVVTVALDTGGVEAAAASIDAASPEHPSLIDAAHRLDELYGIVNVPTGVWIDERGTIVRPPEPAWPGRSVFAERGSDLYAGLELPPEGRAFLDELLEEASHIEASPEAYLAALRDWAANGADSRYALDPDEVLTRSAERTPETSRAAAEFELGQHLHRSDHGDDAVPHFRAAHQLQPDNWTYRRQAYALANPLQGPSEEYDSDYLTELRRTGPANYYPVAPDLA